MEKYSNRHHYPHPADRVLAKFTDREFLLEKYAALGRQDIEILEHVKDDRQSRIRIRYSDKPDMELPSFLKSMVPERAIVEQVVVWDLEKKSGRIELETRGSPVTVKGRLQLRDETGGCSNSFEWEVSCSIPLMGGRVEKAIVAGLEHKSKRDEAESRRLLDRGAGD